MEELTHKGQNNFNILTITIIGYEDKHTDYEYISVVVHDDDLINELKNEIINGYDTDDPYISDKIDNITKSCNTLEELKLWVESGQYKSLTNGYIITWNISHYRERINNL